MFLEWKSTGINGWKKDLSLKFNGLTGFKLSNEIKKQYNIIITFKNNEIFECVNLNCKKEVFN